MRKVGATAGMIGPLLFAVVLLSLTVVEYRFLLSIGWDPMTRPTYNWPSGLSLGPVGWVMIATFLLSGMLMSVFGLGLRAELDDPNGRNGSLLVATAGIAMMGLAFTTDPSEIPVTWHGRLHDLSFLTLGLLLIPAMILCGISFRRRAALAEVLGVHLDCCGACDPDLCYQGNCVLCIPACHARLERSDR